MNRRNGTTCLKCTRHSHNKRFITKFKNSLCPTHYIETCLAQKREKERRSGAQILASTYGVPLRHKCANGEAFNFISILLFLKRPYKRWPCSADKADNSNLLLRFCKFRYEQTYLEAPRSDNIFHTVEKSREN